MSTPLNEEALEAGAKAMYYEEPWMKNTYSTESHKWEELQEGDRQVFREEAKTSVTAYLSALPAPAVVETVETATKWQHLRSLSVGSVVLDADGALMRVVERYNSDRNKFEVMGADYVWDDRQVALPARVLYRPEVKP